MRGITNRIDVRSIRREQILEAAEQLAIERGWEQITILDICQKAGVSSGVLTYHFKNKDEILYTLLDVFIGRIDLHLNTATRGRMSLQEDINGFLQGLETLLVSEPHFPYLLIHFAAASLNRPKIAEKLKTLFAGFRHRKLEEWNAAGILTNREKDDNLILISMLHIVSLGVVLGRPIIGIDLPHDRLIQEVKRVMLLLAADPPPG